MAFLSLGQSKDSCLCTTRVTLKYPEQALKNKISGTVLIEMDLNEDGTLCNPVVINGIGYGCDEEATRIAKKYISDKNACAHRCKRKNIPKKVTMPVVFSMPED